MLLGLALFRNYIIMIDGMYEHVVSVAGVYGDVLRVKILFNKKDTALIQFVDAAQAQRGTLAPSPSSHFSCFT